MARYIKQEMPDLHKDGSKKCYYRMQSSGNVSTDNLIHTICMHGGVGLSESVFRHALEDLAHELAISLAEGYSVTLDGIGTFNATIGLCGDKEMDTIDGDETKRNAQSLELNGINYRPDRTLIKEANMRCELERAGTRRINRSPYTKEERLQIAKDYLSNSKHPHLRITEYAEMTRLPKSSAAKELREFASDPVTGIASNGKATHIVYVLR